MHVSDKWIYTFLFLISLSFVGMILQSWRIILYPYLIVIGLSVLFGLWKSIKRNPTKIWIPISISIIYFILYGWFDALTYQSPSGGDTYFLGLVPSTALYMLTIFPLAVIVCLLYAITFTNEKNSKL